MNKIIKNKQIYETNDKNLCKICNLAKATVLNKNCSHKFCISCTLVETKCPICNSNYSTDDLFYIE